MVNFPMVYYNPSGSKLDFFLMQKVTWIQSPRPRTATIYNYLQLSGYRTVKSVTKRMLNKKMTTNNKFIHILTIELFD